MSERRFGRVFLVSGPESLLAEREVAAFVEAALVERPGASVNRLEARAVDAGGLQEATGGSLFATDQVVVIDGLDELDPELFDAVAALAVAPADDVALVLVHPGGVKGKNLLDRLKKAQVQTIECPAIKPYELPQFAVAEARREGVRLDQATAVTLVEALGHDVRAIVGAIRQLVADAPDGMVTEAMVRRYFSGRADVTSFAVADAILAGRRGEALGALRWALSTGVAPVLVCSAVASALRNVGRYTEARDSRMREAELARVVGVPPWKLKDLARQSRDWTPQGLATALVEVARTDADIKGAATDPGFSLERLVISVTGQRGRAATPSSR